MRNVDKLVKPQGRTVLLRHHLAFIIASALVLWCMFTLLRVALFVYNLDLVGSAPAAYFVRLFQWRPLRPAGWWPCISACRSCFNAELPDNAGARLPCRMAHAAGERDLVPGPGRTRFFTASSSSA